DDPEHAGRGTARGRADQSAGHSVAGRAVQAPPRLLVKASARAGEALAASIAPSAARSSIAAMNGMLPWFAPELACAISCSTTRAKCRRESSTERLTTMFGESHTPSVS